MWALLLPSLLLLSLGFWWLLRRWRFRRSLCAAVEEEFSALVEQRQKLVGEAMWANLHSESERVQKVLQNRVLRCDRDLELMRQKYQDARSGNYAREGGQPSNTWMAEFLQSGKTLEESSSEWSDDATETKDVKEFDNEKLEDKIMRGRQAEATLTQRFQHVWRRRREFSVR